MVKNLSEQSFRKIYAQDIAAHNLHGKSINHFIVEDCDDSSDSFHKMMDYFQSLDQDCRRSLVRFLHEQDRTEYLLYILERVNIFLR